MRYTDDDENNGNYPLELPLAGRVDRPRAKHRDRRRPSKARMTGKSVS